jgi:exodeoxyribonuclease-3
MRCLSWNVNGIRALQRKKLLPWDEVPGCDVICLQETKAWPSQLDPALVEPPGWYARWLGADRKGYSGVAVLSRDKPDEVIEGIGDAAVDAEGRVLAARFGELVVVSAYFPNSQDGGARLGFKLAFCAAMERYLARWQETDREVLLLGDYNIAHRPIDLARPEANEQTPGYLPEERAWFDRYLELGFRDVYRERYPERAGDYTWWSYRSQARARNVGWRLDYGTTTPRLAERVEDVVHLRDVMGSDHCPVQVRLR